MRENRKMNYHINSLETTAHNDRLNRFNAQQGHGYAAEQGNDLYDTINGREAKILGDDNAKNGADRIVNGKLIQTKYCQTARASIDAGFKNGEYCYLDSKGNPMQIEVPSDQYDEAVKIMAKRIKAGKVPNCKNPKEASKLVRKGNLTLKQAVNIAKAATVESIVFDSIHGAVIGTSAAGISASIVFARAIWNGEKIDDALDMAVYTGLEAGGFAFLTSVLSAQLTKTSLNTFLLEPSTELVKLFPTSLRKNLIDVMRHGAPIYGAAATNSLAKLMRTNFIVQIVSMVVLSGKDVFNYANGKISGEQLFKEVISIASGLAGTAGGAALAGALSVSLGPIGIGVAATIGGLIGGGLSTSVTRAILNEFIEDDAIKLTKIINERFVILANEYLLSMEEIDLVLEILKQCLIQSKMLEMFSSNNRIQFADNLITNCIESVIVWRTTIKIPNQFEVMKSAGRIIDGLEQNTFNISSVNNISAEDIAKKLLNRTVESSVAKKAWYVTKQFNSIGIQEELVLTNMKAEEKRFEIGLQTVHDGVKNSRVEFTNTLNILSEKSYKKSDD